MGQAGFADSNGEGAQGRVRKSDGSTAAEAIIKGGNGGFKRQSGDQAAGDGAYDKGNNNVDAGQTQHEHDQHRGNDGIHGKTPGMRMGLSGLLAKAGIMKTR